MKDFYSIEENFNFLYNDIYTLLSENIIESSLSENWLANWYVCNKYNTTKAVELYAADLIIPKLKEAEIPPDVFKSIIDKKLNGYFESFCDIDNTLNDKLYMIENVRNNKITESTFSYLIQDFECDEVVSYIKEGFFNKNFRPVQPNGTNQVFNMISRIKHAVVDNFKEQDKLKYIKSCNLSLLYKLKDVAVESSIVKDMSKVHKHLESLLFNEEDSIIEHTVSELNHINELIDYLVYHKLNESTDTFVYHQAIEEFNSLVESIFFDNVDDEMDLAQFARLYTITEALCEYENTLEASSRIITKGTEKTARMIGNASAKSSGLGSSKSKMSQIKRGAKIIDDRASDAINDKIDRITNSKRDAKREKIITGKQTFKLSRALKTVISAIAAGKAITSLPKQTIGWLPVIGKVKAPLLALATTIISLLVSRAISKKTEESERKRVLLDLETELKITKEKIEDAKGDNAREQKYQLMRIETKLEKEIFRIKHNMKAY